jgi:hypothetical protein
MTLNPSFKPYNFCRRNLNTLGIYREKEEEEERGGEEAALVRQGKNRV